MNLLDNKKGGLHLPFQSNDPAVARPELIVTNVQHKYLQNKNIFSTC